MLNAETKRHIDAARDVLVGVAPNPTTQIDQITYALIYKFMDDMDQAATKAGGEPSFFVGDLKEYAWSNLLSARLGNQEKLNLYKAALAKFSIASQLPELFRTIFRGAALPYNSPETLGLFLKEISFFDYTHPEELGNAYEYLLSIMSAQGDAGQFRTPRHIIDFIVDVINPTKEDKILDPACGTAGFLVSSYNHILNQHNGVNNSSESAKPLTPDERKKLMNNFQGYDLDATMVRIAQVNMYLHQFKNPQIVQYDSLTNEVRWAEKFDVILANPPFMTPKGGIKPHTKFSLKSSRAEVLFIDYIISHLKPKGRAGIVVPEGVVAQAGKAFQALRKNLLENGLYAVISLPAGVFQPYSGVKTDILLIDKSGIVTQDEILFVQIKNDGFDLGSSKKPIEDNDLPMALTAIVDWKSGRNSSDVGVIPISIKAIMENRILSLSLSSYIENTAGENSKWPIARLGDIANVTSGQSPEGKYYNTKADGLPFYQGKTEFTDHYLGAATKWTTQVLKRAYSGDILMSVRAPVGPVNICTQEICIGRGLAAIRGTKVNQDFLFRLLRSMEDDINGSDGAIFASISRAQIQDIMIPLPPLDVQERIVTEIKALEERVNVSKNLISDLENEASLKIADLWN